MLGEDSAGFALSEEFRSAPADLGYGPVHGMRDNQPVETFIQLADWFGLRYLLFSCHEAGLRGRLAALNELPVRLVDKDPAWAAAAFQVSNIRRGLRLDLSQNG